MISVALAFEQLRNRLELSGPERSNVSRQQNDVRKKLAAHLTIDRDFISGSYGRRTAIRPLNDVDLLIILNEGAHRDLRKESPRACLEHVRSALAEAYPGKHPRVQRRSVNIEFRGTSIGYDIVPAFARTGGVYLIPDCDCNGWIETNPEVHKEACKDANRRAGGKLNPLIKIAKQWNARAGKVLRSFHLEVMAYGAFQQGPESFPLGLAELLEHLARAILNKCPEPAGLGPAIDSGMEQSERTRIRDAILRASRLAREAISLEAAGSVAQAHAKWRELLGVKYPERGKE